MTFQLLISCIFPKETQMNPGAIRQINPQNGSSEHIYSYSRRMDAVMRWKHSFPFQLFQTTPAFLSNILYYSWENPFIFLNIQRDKTISAFLRSGELPTQAVLRPFLRQYFQFCISDFVTYILLDSFAAFNEECFTQVPVLESDLTPYSCKDFLQVLQSHNKHWLYINSTCILKWLPLLQWKIS